jgi:prepilin-type N-terminal cleavage/methylation domain-containing protein
MSNCSLFGKKGFGLLEVMAAAVVLGFLIVGLTRLQSGNREAALRIRTRDAAQIVAQQFLDSLSSIGINSITVGTPLQSSKDYKWEGNQKNTGESGITSQVTYTIIADITNEGTSDEKSNFKTETHTMAKKVNLTVSWPFKGSTQSISLSRIIK